MNAERFSQILDQLRTLWDAHVPAQYHLPLLPTGVGLLILGIGIAVLGARMARGGLTLVLAVLGGLAAYSLRTQLDWSPSALLAGGIVAGGLLGFLLFRLWVGLAAAVLCCGLALGVYGSKNIAPYFVEYDAANNFNGAFAIPEAAGPDASIPASDTSGPSWGRFEAWCRDFWLYVQSKESDVNRWVAIIAIGTALLGFLVGSVMPRFTLIIGTAILGSAVVLAGFGAIARHTKADLFDAAMANPRAVGIVSLALVATSLVLQGLLTRRPAAAPAPAGGT